MYRRLADMTTLELLNLYRGLDMEPLSEQDYMSFELAGPSARIGRTDDYIVIEDTSEGTEYTQCLIFIPALDDDDECISLCLTRMAGR